MVIIITILMINTNLFNMAQKAESVTTSHKNGEAPSIKLSRFNPQTQKQQALRFQQTAVSKCEIEDMIEHAYQAYCNGREHEAENLIRTALVFAPDNTPALTLLGRILYQDGKYREAEFIFRKQSKLLPDNADVYLNLGQALAEQQKYKTAIAAMNTAAEKAPNSPVISLNLAGLYSIKGEKEKALKLFRKAFTQLGYEIVPVSFNRAFDSIRDEDEFKQIIDEAKKHNDRIRQQREKDIRQ